MSLKENMNLGFVLLGIWILLIMNVLVHEREPQIIREIPQPEPEMKLLVDPPVDSEGMLKVIHAVRFESNRLLLILEDGSGTIEISED